MEKLINGIIDFRQKCLEEYKEKFAHLALGQAPDALLIACSDSRVVPNLFASTNPGDMFVLRNMGNLIPPYGTSASSEAAAIEFALKNFPVKNIIVCGHSECGAMRTLLEGEENIESPAIKSWLQNCQCSVHTADKKLSHNELAKQNVLQQMNHLRTYPFVQKGIDEGRLNLHGWYFDIATGDVHGYEEEFDAFIVIDETEADRIFSRLKKVNV